jgi:hypothetical protein
MLCQHYSRQLKIIPVNQGQGLFQLTAKNITGLRAIVLTYDRNRLLTEHMISCYNDLWPDHPFIFRIPFNTDNRRLLSERREYVKSVPGIKRTVLTLLQDLDDDEWIYWCIDDKYPIRLIINRINLIYHSIAEGKIGDINGILFCRARRMLLSEFLTGRQAVVEGELLLERKAYQQIWIHQFLQVKVIRYLFESFPDIIGQPKMMDNLKDNLDKPVEHKLYVTANNYAVFGESTRKGAITENCIKSLLDKGFSIPEWQADNPEPPGIMGEL